MLHGRERNKWVEFHVYFIFIIGIFLFGYRFFPTNKIHLSENNALAEVEFHSLDFLNLFPAKVTAKDFFHVNNPLNIKFYFISTTSSSLYKWKKIVGGAKETGYKSAVYIASRGAATPFCSGVLVRRNLVLTAAHCIAVIRGLSTNNVVIGFGDVNDNITVDVNDVMAHPLWHLIGNSVQAYDIGAIFIEAFDMDHSMDKIQSWPTATIPSKNNVSYEDNCKYKLVGYGTDEKHVVGNRKSTDLCFKGYDDSISAVNFGPYGGLGDHGDSGAPVFQNGTSNLISIHVGGNLQAQINVGENFKNDSIYDFIKLSVAISKLSCGRGPGQIFNIDDKSISLCAYGGRYDIKSNKCTGRTDRGGWWVRYDCSGLLCAVGGKCNDPNWYFNDASKKTKNI